MHNYKSTTVSTTSAYSVNFSLPSGSHFYLTKMSNSPSEKCKRRKSQWLLLDNDKDAIEITIISSNAVLFGVIVQPVFLGLAYCVSYILNAFLCTPFFVVVFFSTTHDSFFPCFHCIAKIHHSDLDVIVLYINELE